MADDPTRPLEDLEVKIAFLEAHTQSLDELVREFADRVVSLEDELKRLRQAVESAELPSTGSTERPPHY